MRMRVPQAASPVTNLLTNADLPAPGWPSTNTPGLDTSPARNHSKGSRHTTWPHSMCRPIGTPMAGAPLPATNGNRPHSWAVVPWYSMVAATWAARPVPGERQPHAGGTGGGAVVAVKTSSPGWHGRWSTVAGRRGRSRWGRRWRVRGRGDARVWEGADHQRLGGCGRIAQAGSAGPTHDLVVFVEELVG